MKAKSWMVRPMVLAVGSCFGAMALANPTGPHVINGNVQFQGLGTNNLQVTNSPGSIIHWQGFSVGAGQTTHFQQQSAASAVLNRVVGVPGSAIPLSSIQGLLSSNGRVFLINPAGIVVGPGGVIDTAGFVGSTLNMLDADFLAGKLRFEGGANAGAIINQGLIKVGQGGNVILAAPGIRNDGTIQADGGEIVLAAGQKVTIGSLRLEGVQFEVQAPTDSALNLGKLLADDGAVGVFAGTLKHSGDIRAAALTRDEGGRVVLRSRSELDVMPGSTIVAGGRSGGTVTIQSDERTRVAGTITAEGSAGRGGDIRILGDRVSLLDGTNVNASGTTGGGTILVGGDFQGKNAAVQNATTTFVGPAAQLRADSTGTGHGGRIIVWSDKSTQYLGSLSARGGPGGGDGGFAEVSGKNTLLFFGNADLGAPQGRAGNLLLDPLDLFADNRGGFIASMIDEVTDFAGNAVTVSPTTLASINGNVELFASRYMRINSPIALAAGRSFKATVGTHTIASGAPLFIPDDPNVAGDQSVLEGTPLNRLEIGANITTQGGADITLEAPVIRSLQSGLPLTAPTIAAQGGGTVTITATAGSIDGLGVVADRMNVVGGNVNITARDGIAVNNITGSGKVTLQSPRTIVTNPDSTTTAFGGSLTAGNVTAGAGGIDADARFGLTLQAVTTAGGKVELDSFSGSVTTAGIDTGGGALTINAVGNVTTAGVGTAGGAFTVDAGGSISVANSLGQLVQTAGGAVDLDSTGGNVSTRGILAGSGAVTITGNQISSNRLDNGAIDTTGAVILTARPGFLSLIDVNVNNASSVTASATTNSNDSFSEAFARVTIGSSTPLNATLITATANSTSCGGSIGCPEAAITLLSSGIGANGNINVGTVTATAPVYVGFGPGFAQSIQESVNINTTGGGSILALPGSGNVTARNVTLQTSAAGGGIGTFNGDPINVNAPRSFTFSPNGGFNVNLSSSGTAQLDMTIPVAPVILDVYSGQLTQTGAGTLLDVFAGSSSVAADLNIPTGFDQQVIGANPFIRLVVPNGGLNIDTAVVPAGNNGSTPLPVTLQASGNVLVNNYARTAGSPGKVTTITSLDGSVTLGQINGSNDEINVNANVDGSPAAASGNPGVGNIRFNADPMAGITTAGDVNLNASGNVFLRNIVTTGAGNDVTVTLNASPGDDTIGNAFVQDFFPGVEITSDGRITINAERMGTSDSALQLVAPFVTLKTNSAQGRIGTGGTSLKATTPDLTIDVTGGQAEQFFVSTGTTNLVNLDVKMNPVTPSGLAGMALVESNGIAYAFTDNGTSIDVDQSATAANHFVNGTFKLTTASGAITASDLVIANTGTVDFTAQAGSITLEQVTAKSLLLSAGSTSAPGSISTDAITLSAGGTLSATSHNGDISIDSGSVLGTTGAGRLASVTLRANRVTTGPSADTGEDSTGNLSIGDIFAESVTLITGRMDGTAINAGNIESPNITVDRPDNFGENPDVSLGAITGARTINASNFASFSSGSITGDGAQANISIVGGATPGDGTTSPSEAFVFTGSMTNFGAGSTILLQSQAGGSLIVGTGGEAEIVAGAGSSISLIAGATSTTPLTFKTLDAGAGGTVVLAPGNNQAIQQLGTGTGITADNVTLGNATQQASTINHGASDGFLDLNGVKNISLRASGNVALDFNGSELNSFDYTKTSTASTFGVQGLHANQMLAIGTGANSTVSATSSTNPLDFFFNHTTGGITVGGGNILTKGGTVVLQATGNITGNTINTASGGAGDGARGSVTLYTTGGSIDTGAITAEPTGRSAGISGVEDTTDKSVAVVTNCTGIACGITVSGNVTSAGTGSGGIAIKVAGTTAGGDITQTAGTIITSESPSSVLLHAENGNITDANINSPNVILTAKNAAAASNAQGNVTATLRNTFGPTMNLALTAYNGFDVDGLTNGASFDVLSVATRAAGAGTLTLTAANQTYTFARPANDLFGANANPTLEIITAAGTGGTPVHPTRTTFTAIDGDLLVNAANNPNLSAANLKLEAAADNGNIKLQGDTTNALVLSTGGEQEFIAGQHITVRDRATITGGTQHFRARRGNISFLAGDDANEAIAINATVRQLIETDTASPGMAGLDGNILLTAGNGSGNSVTLAFTGTVAHPTEIDQQIQARGNVALTGGGAAGTDAGALITSAQRQLVRADGDILLTGGAGTNTTARIETTGTGNQQVGENRCFGFPCTDEPYQTNSVVLQAGSGSGALVEIVAAGPQQVLARVAGGPSTGAVSVLAGSGDGASARIRALGTGEQSIGGFVSGAREVGPVRVEAGTGAGAVAELLAENTHQNISSTGNVNVQATSNAARIRAGRQTINVSGTLTLNAATAAAVVETTTNELQGLFNQSISVGGGLRMNSGTVDAGDALIAALGPQSVTAGSTILNDTATVPTAGTGANAIARITTSAAAGTAPFGWEQDLSLGAVTMNGGSASGAFVLIDSQNGSQRLSGGSLTLNAGTTTNTSAKIEALNGTQSFNVNNITLNALGDAATAIANGGAIIQGRNQSKTNTAGTITINGGNGSDALIRNLAGSQDVRANSIAINGGFQNSSAGIFNNGTGTQFVDTTGADGITVTGRANGPDGIARIFNAAETNQTVRARGAGGLTVVNGGVGTTDVRSGGSQTIRGDGGVTVTANTAEASITAATSQSFDVSNSALTVTSNSAAKARIAAGTSQTISQAGSVSVLATSSGNAEIIAGTAQTFTGITGGISLNTTGAGSASIESGSTQRFTSGFLDVVTGPGSSGSASVSAAGNQWFKTTNGALAPVGGASMRVAARGLGSASITSGARQLLEVDYPEIMTMAAPPPGTLVIGATDGQGVSFIQAVDQIVFAKAITLQGGSTVGATAKLTGTNSQTLSVLDGTLSVLGGSGPGATASVDPVTQTMVVNNSTGPSIVVTGGSGAGSGADITAQTQSIAATRGDVALTGNTGAASIVASGPQTLDVAQRLAIMGATVDAMGGLQTLRAGDIDVMAAGGFAGLLRSAAGQDFDVRAGTFPELGTLGTLTLTGNAQVTNTTGEQKIKAAAITLNPGSSIVASGPQTLEVAQNFEIMGATVDSTGGLQKLVNGDVGLTGGGLLRSAAGQDFDIRSLTLTGDAQVTNTSGEQKIVASGDITLLATGGGNVVVSSAGTQNVTARGLDVRTAPGSSGTAAMQSTGGQTVATSGSLAAQPGVGLRVVSQGTGTAIIESATGQTFNVSQQLVMGTLDPGNPSANANAAVGDSRIFTAGNQSITAGSILMQGPSGSNGPERERAQIKNEKLRASGREELPLTGYWTELSADGEQVVTTTTGGITMIGGSGTDSLVMFDPTNQSILSFGDILMQGGSGQNADALINAFGPQSVISQNGNIILIGGSGFGADALILTSSPTQNVQGANGAAPQLFPGPAGGGIAFVDRGNNFDAAQLAANSVTAELIRERDELDETRDDLAEGEGGEGSRPKGAALCN